MNVLFELSVGTVKKVKNTEYSCACVMKLNTGGGVLQ